MRNILFASLLLFFAGCATTPTASTAGLAPAANSKAPPDHGPSPGESAQSDVQRAMEISLKDADSAKYRFGDLYRAKSFKGLIRGGGYTYGWGMDFLVNAKNSFGGYTGFEPWQAFWADGKVYVNRSGGLMMSKVK
jgi:hypothetical protein